MKAIHKIAASLAGTALLVALGVAVSFWAFKQIKDAAEARKHAFVVINRADNLMSELVDAETGQRGYALTGDEAFLGPYLTVRGNISRHLEDLRQLILSGAAQEHLAAVAPLVDSKLAEMSQVIELRRNHDLAAVLALVGGGHGKRLMDSIRAEMRAFMQIEEDALAQHDAQFQSNMRRLFTIIAATSLFTLLLALAFGYLIHRESQHRLRNQVYLETQHLLEIQNETNKQLQQANIILQVSEEKLAVTLNSIGDAVIATDAEGRVTRLNPLAAKLTGWTQAQAAGRPINEIFHIINRDTRQPAVIPVKDTLSRGTIHGLANHTLLIALDGSECAIADSCAPICDRDGQVVGAVLVCRDVTKEYAAQQALRDNAELIRAILNTVMFGIITVRASGGIVETVNAAAEQMFGYAATELIGQNFGLLIAELDGDQRNGNGSIEYYSASDAARAIGLGREVVGRRKDGSIFPMEMAVSKMLLGGQRYFTGIIRDIRARKQAEEALLKAGALQSAIFNSANFSSIATDAKGVIQIFNVGAERMLGYTAADVVDRITPADISDPQEVIARAKELSVELGTPITPGFEALVFKASRGIEDIYELTYIRKDGSRFPAVVSVTALRDAQDAIIGYLLIGTDNTARKRVEDERMKLDQRLRDQHFYTRSLIESNIDAIMTTDPRGIITDVNKQTEALTGCTRDELIGAPFKNHFTDSSLAEAGINRVLTEGKVTNYELTARARDGGQTVVSYNATTFYDRDRMLQGVFAAARDMTELKRYEETLHQKNVELESASRMKSEFLANMSHELRTPLNAVIGFSEVLTDGLLGGINDAQRGVIKDIFDSGLHLLSLINDILDLSKVEAGKMSLDLEAVPASTLFMSCLTIVKEKAASRHIRLELDAAEDLASIEVDVRMVKQIVYNLLSNAVKFAPENGKVTLHAARVSRTEVGQLSDFKTGRSFTLTDDNEFPEFLKMSVADDGIGIAPEGLARLFKPFSQVDAGLGRKFEGTGLGLALVKLLAELHGGVVAVESAVGKGSRFSVWLPFRAPKALNLPPVPAVQYIEAPRGTRTALVVENDLNSAELTRVQLTALGFNVLHAASSEIALALAVQQPLALITLDIRLPDIDGWELLTCLKKIPELQRVPVLILSIVTDVNKGISLGAAAVMQKPIGRKALYDALVNIGLFRRAQDQTLKVLVVDDDPRAVDLITLRMQGLIGTVLRAYGGREAIDVARRELPDVIVLDLAMPEVNGFEVAIALKERSDTRRIPILAVTAKQITAEDRAKLNGFVTTVIDKAEFDRDRFAAEVRQLMPKRPLTV